MARSQTPPPPIRRRSEYQISQSSNCGSPRLTSLPQQLDEPPAPKPGPPYRYENVTYKDGTQVVRRQSRPIGEFGGNLGTLFWTFTIPAIIYYVYGIAIMHEGRLVVPDADFWHTLYFELPEGIAVRPTWKGIYAYLLWILLQLVMELTIPGPVDEGVVQKNGRKLTYRMNGLASFFMSHVVCYGLAWYGFIEPYFVWRNMGALLTGAVIISKLFSLYIYIDWGLLWRNHVDDEEFEEDWGVFHLGEFFNDYFLGVARNPRIGHGWLKVPLDIKRFTNARPSLTGWVIYNQSYLAAIYYGCHLTEAGNPVCAATGDFSLIGYGAIMITVAHWYYIFDYNWNEPAYLTTTDIRHDLYGWMLAYGCMGFLCAFYPIAFLGHIAGQSQPLNDNPVQLAIGVSFCIVGMLLFRLTNIQKHNFRKFIADVKDEGRDPEDELRDYLMWGKPVTYIRTEEGSYLLTGGFWGLARHFNYIGDLIMCIGWAIACSGPSHGFPWPPVSYCMYFWLMDIHRLFRDEARCATKYKQDWVRYKEAVPRFLIPGLW